MRKTVFDESFTVESAGAHPESCQKSVGGGGNGETSRRTGDAPPWNVTTPFSATSSVVVGQSSPMKNHKGVTSDAPLMRILRDDEDSYLIRVVFGPGNSDMDDLNSYLKRSAGTEKDGDLTKSMQYPPGKKAPGDSASDMLAPSPSEVPVKTSESSATRAEVDGEKLNIPVMVYDTLSVKPWGTSSSGGSSRHGAGDISDYFNYGFNDDSFRNYVAYQIHLRRIPISKYNH